MAPLPAKTLDFLDRAIRQPVTHSGTCVQCNGSGAATVFSDFPCATCNGSGVVEADEEDSQ